MTFYTNDAGALSVTNTRTPAAAEDADAVQWKEVSKEAVVMAHNTNLADLRRASSQIVDLSARLNARNKRLVEIEDYVKEAAKEGNDSIDITEFASEFGFSLEVSKEFTMTIEIQGTATFPIGQEPDLSDVDATVELGSYYSGDTEFEVDDTSVYNYDWQ